MTQSAATSTGREPNQSGVALHRVILKKRFLNQRQGRVDLGAYQLGQLADGELIRITNVDRSCIHTVHQPDQSLDQIADVTERAGLTAIPVQRQWFAPQGLNNEIAYHPAVIREHARAVGVEDTRHTHLHPIHALVVETEGLGNALALVVTTARMRQSGLQPR